MTLPDGDRANHGENGLDEGAHCHPHAGLVPNLVADTTDEGTTDKGDHGAKGLLIGDVKGIVMRAVEEPCYGQRELWETSAKDERVTDGVTYLDSIACLEGTPNIYCRKAHCVTARQCRGERKG